MVQQKYEEFFGVDLVRAKQNNSPANDQQLPKDVQGSLAFAPGIEMPSPNPERSSVRNVGDAERSLPEHGGMSPGAPKGNKNALKHGRYAADAIARRREIATLLQTMRGLARATGEGE